jgi:DNA adenine methylase
MNLDAIEANKNVNPFLKWAGGKRWIVSRSEFSVPNYNGRYFEPFLGSGAIFFNLNPSSAVLSDKNCNLIETYKAIQLNWRAVYDILYDHQQNHSTEYYYLVRSSNPADIFSRAANFLYLNRTCWNGLYRENLRGKFNVPKGTKSRVIFDDEDFSLISERLSNAQIFCSDFEAMLDLTENGDFAFIDPPYTTLENSNGFVKYNNSVFSWDDQVRLRGAVVRALNRGVKILMTNADDPSIYQLYSCNFTISRILRKSVISGVSDGRGLTSELLIVGRN